MMECIKCEGTLEVFRICRAIKMRCNQSNATFAIHEVAYQLDKETECLLEQYNVIIYD